VQPFACPGMSGVVGVDVRLVEPVRGDAGLGNLVHVLGANLDLDRYTGRTEQYRVQGLVAVRFGNGDVVLELARQRFVQVMDDAEHPIASLDIVNDDADGVDIEHLGQRQPLVGHLAVDAVEVFFAPNDAGVELFLAQAILDRGLKPLHDLASVAACLVYRLLDYAVTHRVEGRKAKILEFQADGVHAEPVGDRHVDIERFAGDAAALGRHHHRQCAHVVQTVGELDHLAEILRLRLVGILKLHLGQLADPVDHLGDLVAELAGQHLLGDLGVLDDVVQQCRDDARHVHAHFGEHVGDVEWVTDIGLTGQAELTVMGAGAEQVGAVDFVELRPLKVSLEQVGKVAQAEQCSKVVLGIDGRWAAIIARLASGWDGCQWSGVRRHAGADAAWMAASCAPLRAAPEGVPLRRPAIPRRVPAPSPRRGCPW